VIPEPCVAVCGILVIIQMTLGDFKEDTFKVLDHVIYQVGRNTALTTDVHICIEEALR
jgi:hypothetical protein